MHRQEEQLPDYYQILEVSKDASAEQIKKAYRNLALQWHPDKHKQTPEGQAAATKKFQEISDAYKVLGDPELRDRYDKSEEGNYAGIFRGFHGPKPEQASAIKKEPYFFIFPGKIFKELEQLSATHLGSLKDIEGNYLHALNSTFENMRTVQGFKSEEAALKFLHSETMNVVARKSNDAFIVVKINMDPAQMKFRGGVAGADFRAKDHYDYSGTNLYGRPKNPQEELLRFLRAQNPRDDHAYEFIGPRFVNYSDIESVKIYRALSTSKEPVADYSVSRNPVNESNLKDTPPTPDDLLHEIRTQLLKDIQTMADDPRYLASSGIQRIKEVFGKQGLTGTQRLQAIEVIANEKQSKTAVGTFFATKIGSRIDAADDYYKALATAHTDPITASSKFDEALQKAGLKVAPLQLKQGPGI